MINLYQLAQEMQSPIMQEFMMELEFHGKAENFNVEDETFGWLFKIYKDITNAKDIDWFFGYDCKLDEFGFGKFEITKDTYVNENNDYYFAIDKKIVSSGSALWILANINHTLNTKLMEQN